MSNLRTAAEQALEAMDKATRYMSDSGYMKLNQAIDALRAALEQPERAQQQRDAGYTRRPTIREMSEPEQPEQEPVAWIQRDHLQKAQREPFLCRVEPTQRLPDFVPIYVHPPRRTGLPHCERSCEASAFQIEIRRLKAALKEKNHE